MTKATPISRLKNFKPGDALYHYDLNGMIQAIQNNAPKNKGIVSSAKQHAVMVRAESISIDAYSVFEARLDDINSTHLGQPWGDYWDGAPNEAGLLVGPASPFGGLYTNGPQKIEGNSIGWAVEIPYYVPIKLRAKEFDTLEGWSEIAAGTYEIQSDHAGQFFALGQSNDPDNIWWLVRKPQASTIAIRAPSGGVPARVGAVPGSAMCSVLTTNSDDEIVESLHPSIEVWNQVTVDVLTEGERIGQATTHPDGKWWAIVDDCKDTGTV